MLPDPLEILATFLPGDSRVLTRTGIEIHRLQYWADGLEPWVGQRATVRVTYDPRDITYVYVRTPAGTLVKAVVTTPGVKAISLAEWSARRQYERGVCRDPALLASADESLRRNDTLVKEAKASRKVQRRNATAAAGDRYRDASSPTPPDASEPTETIPVLAGATEPFAIEDFDYDV